MSFLEAWLKLFVESHGLVAIFLTMVLESAFVPIPSEIVVPLGGVLAARGSVQLWEVVAVATLANLVGSVVIYLIGFYGGRGLILRYGSRVRLSQRHLDAADRWFAGRGQTAVFVTRMLPGVRSFISLPAGVARMPFGRFALLTTAGSIPWNLALAYMGYVLGANWERLQGYFHRSTLVFYALSACVAIALIAWRWWGWRRARSRTQG